MNNVINAIASSLYILIIQVFIMPIKIVKKSMNAVLSSSKDIENTEFVVFLWFKNSYDAAIVLIYPFFVALIVLGILRSGFDEEAVFSMVTVGYFLPILFGWMKELISIVVVALTKLEEIARNTKKD